MIARFLRKNATKVPINILRRIGNLWSPFLGAGIKITHISPDYRDVRVELKSRWYNKNYVGTHFGGSMYAMTDPFYMMMLINNLGKNYIVWDKAASIDFKKPGKGTLSVTFSLTEERVQEIKKIANSQHKYVFDISVDVFNEDNEVVASVIKTLYVRKKTRVKA